MLHARLKAETSAAHARLETDLGLMRPQLSLADYLRVLQGFHGFHAAAEPALVRRLENPGFLDDRRKLAWLEHDLRHFGARGGEPWAAAAEIPRDEPGAMGMLYVIEGSTLGGQVVSRHLARTLGVSAGQGGRYFASYGQQVGSRWRAFLDVLASPALAAQADAVVLAARATFDLLTLHLCPAPARPIAAKDAVHA